MFHELYDSVLKEKKITSLALAEYITKMGRKISKESIAKYRDGSRTPDPEIISLSAEMANVPVQDFFDPIEKEKIAKNEIRRNREKYAHLFPEIKTRDNMISIKVVLGEDDEVVNIDKRLFQKDVLDKVDENTKIFKMQGNDMEPYYGKNDLLFIDMVNGRNVAYSDDIYMVRYGDIVRIKQVQFLGNGEVKLSSINKEYDDINPTREGLYWEILGKPFICVSSKHNSKFDILG
ncbi:MAG: S24 family peptidase [Sulfurimonas sp.]